jgi:hypothetical protein
LKRENNPGPGAYQPDKADKLVKSKAPAAKITTTEFKKSSSVREITPAPGAYDKHIKPFGSEVSSKIKLGPSGDPRPEERSEWLQSGQSITPGPGFYKGNDIDFGRSSRNTLISRSNLEQPSSYAKKTYSPSILSSRNESLRAKLKGEHPRYMSPTKSSCNKMSGFFGYGFSGITEELKKIHQSNLSVHE